MNYYHFVGNNVHKGIGYVKNMIHYWSGNTTVIQKCFICDINLMKCKYESYHQINRMGNY